jgi:thiamine biosynthesis lipoprotein
MSSGSVDLMRLEAFGGVATVAVASEDGVLDAAARAVKQTVAEFDQACSRFREDSELSVLNASSGSAVRVGPVLLEAVLAALRAARLTGGDVDPTVGEALMALGYDRDFSELPSGDGGAAPRPLRPIAAIPGWRTVVVDADASTIRVPAGVMLDLGATAKALAADRAAARAFDAAACGVLVSFSGDLAIAGPGPSAGWRVRVTDDHRSDVDAPGQWVSLRSGGLATSSTSVRRWRTSAGVAHHLLDPSTGQPAQSVWRTASVTARSCLDANIASTAAIIRGAPAVDWLSKLGLPSRLVGVDGTVRHVAGWPSDGDDLLSGSIEVGTGAARDRSGT